MQYTPPITEQPALPVSPAFLKKRVPAGLCFALMVFMAAALAVFNAIEWDSPLWFSSVFEIVILLLPCVIVLLVSRSGIPFAPISAKRLLFVTGMGVTGYGFTLVLNASWTLLWTVILGQNVTESTQQTVEQIVSTPLWVLILVIAVTPAICEEFFFRGILLKTYSPEPAAAICISSALFALLHYDIVRLFPTFYLGMFFGWVVMRTGNLTAGSILHFLNNLFSVIAMKFSYTFLEKFGSDIDYDLLQQVLEGNPDLTVKILAAELIIVVLLLISVPLFILLLVHFIRDTREDVHKIQLAALDIKDRPKKLYGLLFIVLAVLMIGVIIFHLIAG